MFGLEVAQGLAFTALLVLAAAVALARPHLSPHRPRESVATEGGVPGWTEIAWLAAVSVLLVYTLLVLLAPHASYLGPWTIGFPGDEIVQAVGFTLWVGGALLAGWALRALGRYTTVKIQITETQPIVRSGPYRWIRHPMYSAILVLSIGATLLFLSPIVAIDAIVLFALAEYRATMEERMFTHSPRLGVEYERLVAETGRFFPGRPRGGSRAYGTPVRKDR
jgi:protein-S-isoprenylcysteine O-methyltransferase Ste14